MTLVTICEWTGKNFSEIVSKIAECNTETLIKVIGNRIIIKDNHINYYQNIVIGDMVEIPIYPECIICDEVEEPEFIQPRYAENSEELLKKWGLL